jgi:hypothetical protein
MQVERPSRRRYVLTREDRRDVLVGALVPAAVVALLSLAGALPPVHAIVSAPVVALVAATAWVALLSARVREAGYRGVEPRSVLALRRGAGRAHRPPGSSRPR